MYCVVKTITNVGSVTEASAIPKVYVYFCKTKRLAREYVKKKYDTRIAALLKKSKEGRGIQFEHCGINHDNTWSFIEYVDESITGDSGYKYTTEETRIVRGKEILDLPNGPALRVE